MPGALGGPRLLLKRLREVMAEPVSAQERLDKTVVLIAANMVAEVCSTYVLRSDDTLELYATEGLNPNAVHLTTMRKGEGLVGLVAKEAEAVATADAQTHPAFSYKPETGEELYHAFLGVPILRAGETLGVLVVQNRAHRVYSEEEIEALLTVSMVLAEMIASGELQALARPGADIAGRRPLHLTGASLAEGVGLGHVVLHEPRVVVKTLIAEDPARETQRLEDAIEGLRDSIDSMLDRGDVARAAETREILEAYRMFAHDRGWLAKMREVIATGVTAEAAVQRVQSDTRARMQRVADPILRERLYDLDDLANRLLRQLTGDGHHVPADRLPKDAILVARSMGPAALLDYNRDSLRGLILEEGGPTSHVAIVARALGIAAVGEVSEITNLVEEGDAIIVDGSAGAVQVRPAPDVEAAYAEKVRFRARRQEQYQALRSLPSRTKDGRDIGLYLNAGLLVDLPHVRESGAHGIGLFRTELQFMIASQFPRTSEQQALYKAVLEAAGDRSVTFRTLDIGGDKVLPYMHKIEEENPALGWRAIRLGLDRPGLMRSQLRALLQAAAGRELRVMFPMVAAVEEFDHARAMMEREIAFLRRHGKPLPDLVKLGAMVEVPSILWQLDEILARVDFLSVGSNDLFQFLFAVDRGNARVAGRFDTLSVPILRALRFITDKAAAADVPVTLCGELASRPLEAAALIGVGFRLLSMNPAAIGPVKAMLMEVDAGELESLVTEHIAAHADKPLRAVLREFAERRGVPL
ncbi:phosphoenolpyruvate--protein phosphotransferase [Labrys wisconsinensis]|uniref:phosphoenolpyruvate--protein phosphotransferase n=1 Tax=Labrys wisconsinensis TaxID=425677 RepID=A0ABU0JK69_9HYPH|nr:phosphoenolpyruvate--protein phosphotransferase [Labrys wisconsinensis]MDQ0474680.1 phosphotransferase system enzyme I (PtsP) [Labrys wisconsinensis]